MEPDERDGAGPEADGRAQPHPGTHPAVLTRLADSALRVLRSLAGLLQPVLLTLLDPRVAGQEARLLQAGPVLDVQVAQCPSDGQPQRAGLAGNAPAAQVGEDVDRVNPVGGHQRVADQLLMHLAREVVLQRAAVEHELAGARHEAHPDDGLLAAANGLDQTTSAAAGADGRGRGRRGGLHRRRGGGGFCHDGSLVSAHCAICLISNGTGCCAACGCSGPAYTLSFLMRRRPSLLCGSMPFTASSIARSWRLLPVSATLPALTTITKSPVSTWGANVGLCLPRRRVAAWLARRPSTMSDASMTCQCRWISPGFGLYVRTGLTCLLGSFREAGVGSAQGATPAAHARQAYPILGTPQPSHNSRRQYP